MKKNLLFRTFAFLLPLLLLNSIYANRGNAFTTGNSPSSVPEDFDAGWRKGVTSGYYLGFTSLADELRQLRRPSDIPVTDGFIKAFYLDFHYANQEFNSDFFKDDDPLTLSRDLVENDVYGITIGLSLGDNPNLDVKIPLSVSFSWSCG